MKRKIIVSIVLFMSACSSPSHKADVFKSFDNATSLYICYYFFNERSQSSDDILQKNKLAQVSSSIRGQAQSTAVEAGGVSLDDKISKDAGVHYKKIMLKILNINTPTDRNKEISKFLNSCADISEVILK